MLFGGGLKPALRFFRGRRSGVVRRFIQRAQLFQFISEFDFKATPVLLIEMDARCGHRFRQVGLAGGVGLRFVVGVAVVCAVAFVFVHSGRGIAQVQRHGMGGVRADVGKGGFHRFVAGVAFRRQRQIDDGLGEGEVAFGCAEALVGLVGVQGEVERVRVGVADIFARDTQHAPRDGQRVGAAVYHAREPVHGAVRIRAAQGFVEGGKEFVEPVALFVQRFRLVGERLREGVFVACAL